MTLAVAVHDALRRINEAEGQRARIIGLHSVVPLGNGAASIYFDVDWMGANEGTLCLIVPERLVVGLSRDALLKAVGA